MLPADRCSRSAMRRLHQAGELGSKFNNHTHKQPPERQVIEGEVSKMTREYCVFFKFKKNSRFYTGTVGIMATSENGACRQVYDTILKNHSQDGLDLESILVGAS